MLFIQLYFFLFCSYSLLHASRKTFSNVKVSISKQWTPSAFNRSIEPVEVNRPKSWDGFKGTVPIFEFFLRSLILFHLLRTLKWLFPVAYNPNSSNFLACPDSIPLQSAYFSLFWNHTILARPFFHWVSQVLCLFLSLRFCSCSFVSSFTFFPLIKIVPFSLCQDKMSLFKK